MMQRELSNVSGSDYMNPSHLAYFHHLLLDQRRNTQAQIRAQISSLNSGEHPADECDQANDLNEWWRAQRLNRHDADTLKAIDAALRRISDGSYGYCEETGDPIGIPRLLAQPTAILCLEAMARREHLARFSAAIRRPVSFA